LVVGLAVFPIAVLDHEAARAPRVIMKTMAIRILRRVDGLACPEGVGSW
jgi:hypothetical protein